MESKVLVWSKLLVLDEEIIKKQDDSPAVYRISKKETDGKYYVVFVGNTLTLREELLDILKEKSEKKDDKSFLRAYLREGGDFSFRYALVAEENIRKGAEKQMFKHYAPKLNLNDPGNSLEIQVNLN